MNRELFPAQRIAGSVKVPGDKSISHRAAIFGTLAHGTTMVRGFLRGLFGRSVDVVLGIGPRLDVASVLLDLGGDVAVVGRHLGVSVRRGLARTTR